MLTVDPADRPAIVVLDYGQEVGGTPYVNVSANTPTAPATSNNLRISTSEALPFLNANTTTSLARDAAAGDSNVKVASVAPFYVGSPITIGTGARRRDADRDRGRIGRGAQHHARPARRRPATTTSASRASPATRSAAR